MSKIKESYESRRRYRTEWERDFPWIRKATDGSENSFCKICKKTLQPRKKTIQNHADSADHKRRAGDAATSRRITFPAVRENEATKKAEIELAVAVCCHCSVLTIDHLGDIISRNATGSPLENLRLHRTKCSKIISNIIGPVLKESLQEDIQEKKFSLLVDETTDVSSDKTMCICVRYCSEKEEKIMTRFLEIVLVTQTTGKALFNAVKLVLDRNGLNLSNCIGFGSDGARNMVGEKNSLWSRIRNESPNCAQMRCICHSLALCIQKGFDKLPSNLGYILSEVPKWFSKSALRRDNYKELFEVMDPNCERTGTPNPFKKISATRWLVKGKVLYNILINWEELKAYFSCAEPTGKPDARFKARLIADMLKDKVNKLYFHFATPVVKEFEEVNALFQATDADPEILVKELNIHYQSLKQRVYDRNGDLLPLSSVKFGAKFLAESDQLLRKSQGNRQMQENVLSMKKRCQDMLLELVVQVEERLPQNKDIFSGLRGLSPSSILSQTSRLPFSKLPFPHLLNADFDKIESQYRKILCHVWNEESVFEDGGIPADAVQFWRGVSKYEDSAGRKSYKELAMYALSCLCTPVSNAVVERIFSHVSFIKTKLRNRISLKMLDAILRVRTSLLLNDQCCKDFVITPKMLQLFNSETLYANPDKDGEYDISALTALN